ncbi:MAG: acetyl-CoA carboxylase carboxyl transferase subunit beta, partial [Kiritimatiellaceae bacterium]|nr:acetyl-CoA carboxylase carboxyl transferase subunit beta [Kiritimatiellaceae bacterium]
MALLFSRKNYSTVNVRKRDVPDGLWEKCPGCDEILYAKELNENLQVCPKCDHHFMLDRQARIDLFCDEGTFEEWDVEMTSSDPLGFTGKDSYIAKLEANQKKTGSKDAVTCGAATLNGRPVGIGVMDFKFLGASMGSVVGEKLTRQIERCTAEKRACIIVCASGGARMYEGLFSLMQMAKTSAALARH